MKVIEKNEGPKVEYQVNGTKINFAGEITLDLSRYERDFDVHLDICMDKFGFLVMGLAERYVAQIDIPARTYIEKEGTGEEGEIVLEPVPFSMDNVTLTLWAVGGSY